METKNLKTYLLIGILVIATVLRLWRIDQVPVSLFGDELDVGYHAYSILKTGKDYSGNSWPLHFQSLAEWRTPLYLYSAVPTVALFGISPLGVRLPAAIFGILGVFLFYLLIKLVTGNWKLATLAGLLLAISPWHLQYSRAGFEVTQMLTLYLAGLLFFFKGLKEGKLLPYSALFLGLTPWVYSTAKFFLPLTILGLLIIWRKDLFKVGKKYLLWTLIVFILVVAPITWSTLFGGGTARFGYISVFTDPTTIPEIGFSRLRDSKMDDPEIKFGAQPDLESRVAHNKFQWWGGVMLKNYLQTFSSQFLFINGDLNARHAVQGAGEFYKFEGLFILLGLVFLLTRPFDRKLRIFLLLWLVLAPIPAAMTRDGGSHATRLFFLLPVLVFLSACGIYSLVEIVKERRKLLACTIIGLYLVGFLWYQHQYWVHYPWDSERWWHAGFESAIKTAVAQAGDYDKVIFSMAGEPTFIFFLGWSQYPPEEVQDGLFREKETVANFGEITKVGKYYFGTPNSPSVYELAKSLPDKTLYVATAREVGINLITEPDRKPGDLNLLKAVAFPSGEPAYYLFTKN